MARHRDTDDGLEYVHRRRALRAAGAWGAPLLLIAAACGCQHGSSPFDPLNRAIARQQVRSGDERLAAGDQVAAVAAFERALRHDPRSADAHVRLARLRERQCDFDGARDHYAAAVRYSPTNRELTLEYARALHRTAAASMHRRELLEAAVRACLHARELQPAAFDAAWFLARVYRDLGRTHEAEDAYLEAVELNPDAAIIRVELGGYYESLERHADAAEQYAAAIRLDPADAQPHVRAGIVQLAIGERHPDDGMYRARALAHFRRAIELDPHRVDAASLLRQLTDAGARVAASEDAPN